MMTDDDDDGGGNDGVHGSYSGDCGNDGIGNDGGGGSCDCSAADGHCGDDDSDDDDDDGGNNGVHGRYYRVSSVLFFPIFSYFLKNSYFFLFFSGFFDFHIIFFSKVKRGIRNMGNQLLG